jgi:TolA-binding protein
VHGTEFSVEVDTPEEGVTRTCVRVESGVVVVHHVAGQIELGAGKTWGCDPLADGISAGRAGDEQAHVPGRIFGSRGAAPQRGRTSEGTVRGTLAEETRLLQTALAAERSGETTLAGERLRTLLRRFPDSPLAPDARQALGRVASRESREP